MSLPTELPRDAARRLAAGALKAGFQAQALHVYTDAEGQSLHWRIRLKHPDTGEKWVRPMKHTEQGFVLGEPTYPSGKPLYNLATLAAQPDAEVWITEGEWAADAVAKCGVLATTSGAADSAGAADWSPLVGRRVRIWPDNDPAGQRYADALIAALRPLGCDVRIVDVAVLGLEPKGDAVDWLDAHPDATAAEVLALPCLPRASCDTPAGTSGWPAPQPLAAKIEPEPYPLEALPDAIRAAVEEVHAFVQAPVALVAASAIAALSLAAQAHADVKRAEKLHGPVGLYLLTIADSGERKSTCDGFFMQPIRDFEAAQAEAGKVLLADYEAELAAWEAKHGGIRENLRHAAKKGKPTASMEADLRNLERHKPQPPRIPKLLYADATPEALAWNLAKRWPSGGVVSAEAGIVLGAHGMGKDSVMRNLALLNQLWDGSPLSIDRRSSESFTVRGARVSVGLQVQEATLHEFFSRSGALARGTGFLARFLLSWPESTQGARSFREAPKDWPRLAAFHQRLSVLLEQPALVDGDGVLALPFLCFTPEAKAAWVEYHDAVEAMLGSGGELYDVRDVAAKSADNAARLAALFQLFKGGIGGVIELEAFEGASAIAAWHLHEARRFFGELELSPELAAATCLDRWLITCCKREQTRSVPTKQVQQYGPAGLREKAVLDAALRVLEEASRVRLVQEGRQRRVEVNPALLHEENGA